MINDKMREAKEDTIFVEVPADAVNTSANAKMCYFPSGPFTLPKGYQIGSPVVYIYYDVHVVHDVHLHVAKPLTLKLPHWYGGENHTEDGLSFVIAPHSLKEGKRVYNSEFLGKSQRELPSLFPGKVRKGLKRVPHCCDVCISLLTTGNVHIRIIY